MVGPPASIPKASPPMRPLHLRRTVLVAAVAAILAVAGYAVFQYLSVSTGITRSEVLAAPDATAQPHADTNILVMGLDSRLDENGKPLPKEIYDALHSGDQSDGGLNANVLMLVHVPGDGSKATEISIPRDDDVALAGCPDKQCSGKIKQAYGLAADQESQRIVGDASLDAPQRQQRSRDAGRTAQIQTVQDFLGVHVDHFVEVTMVAFYQLAQVVQPITVCVLNNTEDRFSGASFHQGQQQIDAVQAVAFVRQRRDEHHPELNFTDLDRERRQQAFIVSLSTQLKQAGTLANPMKLSGILDVVKQNTAIDSGLDLLQFAQQASQLTGGNVTFYTLPIERYGKNARGEDVNVVDVPKIRATVKQLLTPAPATPQPANPTGPPSGPATGPAPTGPTSTSGTPPAAAGTAAPPPTQLSMIGGGGIPCVK